MISLLVLDVDGVLTNGAVWLDEDGCERKTLFFRDIDAVHEARRAGVETVLLSGEKTPLLDTIAARLGVERVVGGRKDKEAALSEIAGATGIPLAEVCYVGDGIHDVGALGAAGFGLAPSDASPRARAAADVVLDAAGGRGAVEEAVELVLARR